MGNSTLERAVEYIYKKAEHSFRQKIIYYFDSEEGKEKNIDINKLFEGYKSFVEIDIFKEHRNRILFYTYIKKLKRQIDLHDKEQGKIDRLTMGLKLAERKIESLENGLEDLKNQMKLLGGK